MTNNPLISPTSLKNHAINFSEIRAEHYLPALDWAIQFARKSLDDIRKAKPATFKNVVEALELATEKVDLVATVYYNLLSAEATPEVQKLAEQFGPKLSAFSSDLSLDEQLFAQVRSVYEGNEKTSLNIEEKKLLNNTWDDFVRNGALLNDKQKQRLREIDHELSILGPKFSENVLKATNSFEMLLTDASDLAGLPDSAKDMAKHEAEAKGKTGWLFSLQGPSYTAFLTYSERRDLREKLWRVYNTKCVGGEWDNRENILKIVRLRHERAQLLGFKTHADFVLKKRMAESADKVMKFLDDLAVPSMQAAKKELIELESMGKELGISAPLKPWDMSFVSEKLKQKTFNFDQEQLRPYFKLENVIAGVFKHAELLFDLEFRKSTEYPVYHPDVEVFEVYNRTSQAFVGVFYTDFFPRPTKRDGAWMANFHEQGLFAGEIMRPHVSITCNFTKSTKDKPSLLTFNEVLTLFHEFGHSLHGLLSQCRYQCLGGTNVYWDFVELPSQLMENWIYYQESLNLFARHYQTGEALPESLAQKVLDSSKFLAGSASLRQLMFGYLDMAWHSHSNPSQITDVLKFEKDATAKARLLEYIEGTTISCGFGHIFSGGYSAGYYSYKWAQVLDADAFEFFLEKGLFNKTVADKYRQNILERGGTEHPSDLYRRFRGRDPDPKALLKREGLIA